jgi:hypothetical protein
MNAGPANAEPSCDLGRPELFPVPKLADDRGIGFGFLPL